MLEAAYLPVSPIPGEIAAARETPRPVVSIPLVVERGCSAQGPQPITLGVPLPRGAVPDPDGVHLLDGDGTPVLVQSQALSRWSDGSVKWLLADFLLPSEGQGQRDWRLEVDPSKSAAPPARTLRVQESSRSIVVDTGMATFHIGRDSVPFSRVLMAGRDLLEPNSARMVLTDCKGRAKAVRVDKITVETARPVRATIKIAGSVAVGSGLISRPCCRFVIRVCFFAGTALVRIRATIHNPNRARHRGGLWDLGDPGSVFLRELALELRLARPGNPHIAWTTEIDEPPKTLSSGRLEIYQDSSGGENWRCKNHVNRQGRVPCVMRGYRVRSQAEEQFGLRASPIVSVGGSSGSVTAALPEFWQQFPKAVEIDHGLLRLGLFPRQFGDLFELQGGEEKTHTLWLQFDPASRPETALLEWAHQPARVHARPNWYTSSGAIPYLALTGSPEAQRLDSFLADVVKGQQSLFGRREWIDEYGWRNYGEIYADHERLYYQGPLPLISHFNNQYDAVYGLLLQYLRNADTRWFDLADALARHVMDIDIYHTVRDKASYSGGMFWHTDHYRDAATATHRAFSRWNCPGGGRPYGGGPCAEHNYTSGLLHYYFLTGEPRARQAVIGLADWVIHCDDGRGNLLGIVDDGPTGWASNSGLGYHGPGRGCGNSVNALLDAWTVTQERHYLEKAESLLRRSIHPADDVAARDLLNVESRWFYTIFLSVVSRYLTLKAEAGEIDLMFSYAQASLLAYARWMLENEVPYFDHPEKLQFPTETWGAQELRKANVFRLAAAQAEEPLRGQLLRRGNEFAERAWSDLLRFSTCTVARALAIVLTEGPCDVCLRPDRTPSAPRASQEHEFGRPQAFIPQKARVRAQLRSWRGLARAFLRLADVRRWWLYCSRNSKDAVHFRR
jgi:hypothetical protein